MRNIIIGLLFCASTCYPAEVVQTQEISIRVEHSIQKIESVQISFPEFLASVMIGAASGVAARVTDDWFPLNWLLICGFRGQLARALAHVKKYDSETKEAIAKLFEKTAEASDWLAYLLTCRCPPTCSCAL